MFLTSHADSVCVLQMAAYEATSELSRENERLRLGIAAARESAARAEEEASRARYQDREHCTRLAAGR